ncbi:aldehyde dehydrogenase family protein [Actinoplanes sp. TBRC 11911]|uniref:aldehyde dehydrogenase family protein n=1 Tax=Actinoplanes sp. TBRC 11911 TaxID=2729386 RepID=UPI00145F41E5|nr:aldehyde dehydrogenase family protein [Actinoplanes sp. TBRC 11911]NMO55300.1 aldehyde dehydrogenase family protein [Actinoplanes sp. TBRC 11911]
MTSSTIAGPTARGLLINGTEQPAVSGRTTEDRNPATGDVYVTVPAAATTDVDAAITAASAAFPGWAATAPSKRRDLLERAADLLQQRTDEFAEIMRNETAGTDRWARFNIELGVKQIRHLATMAAEPTGKLLATDVPGQWSMAVRSPAGVVVSIVPWNGPMILCARAITVALAVGNTVVIRPSEDAPITSGLFLAQVLKDAGIPDGVVNVVTNDRADAPEIIEALIAHPATRRVNFTGSTTVGRIVGRLAGQYLKPVILELGGKNPILVLDDADVDKAAEQSAFARFFNAGQICLSVDRIIVDDSVAAEFTAKFLDHVRSFPQGDLSSPDTVVGPLINARAAARVADLVSDAVAKGAQVLFGGGPADGAFHPATVLTGVTPDMRIHHEEIFGPVAVLYTVGSADEAVALANDTEYGLSSAVYTRNGARGLEIARQLQHGSVHINTVTVADDPEAPVGGVKDSGYGHFGSEWGVGFFTDTRWVTLLS